MKNAGTDVSADDYNAEFSVGQYVKFGMYRQTESPKNNEPIEWQVLDRDGDNALLLSRSCLDVQGYNEEACTWETSWLRRWLNGEFLNTAFSAKEQTAILLTDVDNSAGQGNPKYSEEHVDSGNNTQDKVFLLSYAEANKYLEVGSKTNGEKARTSLTEYALLAAGSNNEKSSTSAASEQIQKPLELTYRRTADASKKRLTKVMPDVSLYPHYNRIRSASRSAFPGVKIVVNAGGTEYRFASLREVTEQDDMDDYDGDAEEEAAEKERKAVYGRVVAKDTEKYDLDQKAKKMQSLFHVSESAFDPRHDRECELEEGYLHRAYMLSGLRSFAWTLADYCKQQNCTPDEIDSGEASRIADFVAGRNWLNYDGTTYCQGLCSGMDIHVFFIPDESDPADREKLLPSQEDFDRVKRMREVFPAYDEVLPEVNSLNALRKDLAYIYPAIQVMWDNLAKDRNYDEALLGNEADIVYAWCALALAAKEPFFSEDGPMTCYFSRILSEEEKQAKYEEQRAKYEAERAKYAEKWLQEYGKYIEANPSIDINCSLFVFTGLGHDGPEKEKPVVQKLIEKGGQYRSSISGRTNYLVVNPREAGESKIEAVLKQREKGKDIKVILLEDLKKALGMKEPEKDAVSGSGTSPANVSAKAMSIPNGKKTISEDALRGAYEAEAWWLRTPGETQARAMCVAIDGSTAYDDEVVAVQGVRPALWVNLKSLQTSEESGENQGAAKTSEDTDIVGGAAKESKRKHAEADEYSWDRVFGKYDGPGGDVVIPDGIKKIGDKAFNLCTGLTSVEIPSSVKYIGEHAFEGCENLTSVSLPEGLEEIGDGAFWGCKDLKSVRIPASLTKIGEDVFEECDNLETVIVYGDRYSGDILDAMKEHFPVDVSVIWKGSEGSADAGKSPAARDSADSDVRRSAANDEGRRILSYNDEIQFALPEDWNDCQMIWSTDEDGNRECNIVMGEYTDDDGETKYLFNVSVAVVDGNIDEEEDWTTSDEEASDGDGLFNVASRWRRISDRMGMRVTESKIFYGLSTFVMLTLYVQLDQNKQIRFINMNPVSEEDEISLNAMFMRFIADILRYQGNALIMPSIGDEAEPGCHLEAYNDEVQFSLPDDYQMGSDAANRCIITKGKFDAEITNNPFFAAVHEMDISARLARGESLLDYIQRQYPEYRLLSLSTEPEAVLGIEGPFVFREKRLGTQWHLSLRVSDTQMIRIAIFIMDNNNAHEYIKELVKALRYKGKAIQTTELTDAELDRLAVPLGSDTENQSDSAISPQKDSSLDERVAPAKTTPPDLAKTAAPTPAETTPPAPAKAAAPSESTASAEPRPAAEPEAAAALTATTRRRRSQAQRLAELAKQEEAAEQAERLSTEEKPAQEAPAVSVKMIGPVPPIVSGKPFVTVEEDDPEEKEWKGKKIRRRRSAGKFLITVGICMILLFGVGIVKGRADVNHIWAIIAGVLEIGLGATWTKQE